MDKLNNDWYVALVDDCKGIVTETIFSARWTLIEGYHTLGERILQDNQNFEREKIYGENIVQRLAKSLETSERTIYYVIQFVKKYPDLDMVPEGKNISWNKLCTKYLPAKSDAEVRQGKPLGHPMLSSSPMGLFDLLKYKTYLDYVEAQPCIVCGGRPVDKSHFPKTAGSGAPEEWVVPMCRSCHTEYHLSPMDWMQMYKDKWAAYYYNLILRIWDDR